MSHLKLLELSFKYINKNCLLRNITYRKKRKHIGFIRQHIYIFKYLILNCFLKLIATYLYETVETKKSKKCLLIG